MSEIKISVVMSVYNAEKYLREAIESILYQTFYDFEFIIINDGSTDNSLEIIKSYSDNRIVLIDQINTGLAMALNNGIKKSRSEYIARMDADDVSMPERLEKQYIFLENNLDHIIVGCNGVLIDKDGNYIFTSDQPAYDEDAKKNLPETPFFHSSVMMRKNVILKSGGYLDGLIKGQDTVLFNRMAKFGKFANLKEPLIKYRIVPTANSVRRNIGKRFWKILDKAIESNEISDNDSEYLANLLENRQSDSRVANYHIFLAKKYLWNNYNPKLARKNIYKSIIIKLSFGGLGLFFISLLPETIVKNFYQKFKM